MIEKTFGSLPNSVPKILKGKLIDKVWFTPKIVRLKIANHDLANFSQPGQFVNVKVTDNYMPLLRRPFSIHGVNRQEKWFEILLQVIGKGTELLSKYQIGKDLDIFGPLGNSFSLPVRSNHAILIAGGLGIAPLLFLAKELTHKNFSVTLFWGNKTKEAFCSLEDFEELGLCYFLATEDGSLGFEGKITELVELKKENFQKSNSVIYACGPNPMLQKIKEFAHQSQIPCQVSLETIMACGFGVCLGCNVTSTNISEVYKYVCKDGPVFYSSEIDLSE